MSIETKYKDSYQQLSNFITYTNVVLKDMNPRIVQKVVEILNTSSLNKAGESVITAQENLTTDVTLEKVLMDFAKQFMDATQIYRVKFMELKNRGDDLEKAITQLKEVGKFDQVAVTEYENNLRAWVEEFEIAREDILNVMSKLDVEKTESV